MKIYDEQEITLQDQPAVPAGEETAPEVSVFLPVYNEEPNLRPLHLKLDKALKALGRTAEAATYFEEALAVATDGEILLRMAKAHMALGITARAMGQLQAAKQRFRPGFLRGPHTGINLCDVQRCS